MSITSTSISSQLRRASVSLPLSLPPFPTSNRLVGTGATSAGLSLSLSLGSVQLNVLMNLREREKKEERTGEAIGEKKGEKTSKAMNKDEDSASLQQTNKNEESASFPNDNSDDCTSVRLQSVATVARCCHSAAAAAAAARCACATCLLSLHHPAVLSSSLSLPLSPSLSLGVAASTRHLFFSLLTAQQSHDVATTPDDVAVKARVMLVEGERVQVMTARQWTSAKADSVTVLLAVGGAGRAVEVLTATVGLARGDPGTVTVRQVLRSASLTKTPIGHLHWVTMCGGDTTRRRDEEEVGLVVGGEDGELTGVRVPLASGKKRARQDAKEVKENGGEGEGRRRRGFLPDAPLAATGRVDGATVALSLKGTLYHIPDECIFA